jgi:hypothetical protein
MASINWHKVDPDVIEITVKTISLDTFCSMRALEPNFVKIDVEGADGEVITGFQHTIGRCRPVIFIECSDLGRERVWEVMKNRYQYRCFNAASDKEVGSIDEYRHADFLWVPDTV